MSAPQQDRLDACAQTLKKLRLSFLTPIVFLVAGRKPGDQVKTLLHSYGAPAVAIVLFLFAWNSVSSQIVTKYGAVPGPPEVASAWGALLNEARLERIKEREYLHRNREKRLQALTASADLIAKLPDGSAEVATEGVSEALATMTTAYERVSSVLDAPRTIGESESLEAGEERLADYQEDAIVAPVATIAFEKLLPVELAFKEATAALETDPAYQIAEDASEDETRRAEKALAQAERKLARQKANLLITRQQLTTEATKAALAILDSVPRNASQPLKAFDKEAMALGSDLSAYHLGLEELVATTGERNPDLFKAKMLARAFEERPYPGKETYIQQIITSLKTVFFGFLIASAVAVPVGILCGLNPTINNALNPFIQIFKPVSPLAWLPIVMIVVGALVTAEDPLFELSFINSAITVALCCLWPTLVNTAVGVASTDKDYINVAKVLKLSWIKRITKIVLPAALPLMFTGLRLSLGVGWMVLIAAEMLAQNPGLGKFVWDMFQNGSSQTLSMIMVAVFTIGFIGFALDNVMLTLQRLVTFEPQR